MPKAAPQAARRIEYVPLSELKGADRNPKAHDLSALAQSVHRFGYVEPVVIDERTNRLVAGHGRVEFLRQAKSSDATPPDGIEVKGNEWLVPVIRGWTSKDDAQAKAYLLASNRVTELGGWDDSGLLEMLSELALDEAGLAGSGYKPEDIDALLRATADEIGSPDEDEVPEAIPPERVYVKPGQLWLLGEHRLICGDSTDRATVAKLLGDAKPGLMMTDPPYGVEYDPAWRQKQMPGGASSTGVVLNDDRVDWSAAYRLFPGNVAYVWHAGIFSGEVQRSIEVAGLEVRGQIIWAKQHFAISRGAYHIQHEPCWYAVRKGANANWCGDRKQTTLWAVQTAGGFGSSKDQADDAGDEKASRHGTQKPVELYRRAILNHTKRLDAIYEPFSGSGTAIIAAEQLQRRCLAVELAPQYVQQAVERWQKFTGQKASKET